MQKHKKKEIIYISRKKSSTFATDFERKGTIKTTPDSLTCVRDYREFRCKSTTFFWNMQEKSEKNDRHTMPG